MAHAARTLALLLTFAALALAAVIPARGAPAGRVLELDASWYRIVVPWRYEESRRFERGWHRAAGVVAARGRVVAPLAGRVRFAGRVAGRNVVTIDATLGGAPVVVTLTGLAQIGVDVGERVGAGASVGRGERVMVGAYDPDRRSRYFRVRERPGTPLAREQPSGDRSTISGGIAGRLLDAIDGTATATAPSTSTVAVGSAAAPDLGVSPLTGSDPRPRAAPGAELPSPRRSLRPGAIPAIAVAHARDRAPSASRWRSDVVRRGAPLRPMLVGTAPAHGPVVGRARVSPNSTRRSTRSPDGGEGHVRSPGDHGGLVPSRLLGPALHSLGQVVTPQRSAPGFADPTGNEREGERDGINERIRGSEREPASDEGRSDAARHSVSGAVVALLVLLVVAVLRGRRVRAEGPDTPIHPPIPARVPEADLLELDLAWIASRDEFRDPLAWPDAQTGTSPDTSDERARDRARTAEHA